MHESVRICARERVSMLVLVQKTWMCWDCMFLTLTLQSIWPGKAGGSKTPRKRSQTQLVHLLVSSPKCASLFPVRHVLNRQNKVCTSKKLRKTQNEMRFSSSAWLRGLTVQMETVRAVPSPSSSSSCSLESVCTMKLRMKRAGRTIPRAPHRNEWRRTLLL